MAELLPGSTNSKDEGPVNGLTGELRLPNQAAILAAQELVRAAAASRAIGRGSGAGGAWGHKRRETPGT
jgi:hypothetical protein